MLENIRPEYAQSPKTVAMMRPALLFVKADWCPHCKTTRPIMEKVAHALGTAVRVVTVDSEKNKQLIRQLGVTSYPTLIFVSKDGTMHTYTKPDRTFDSIIGFVCQYSTLQYCARKK